MKRFVAAALAAFFLVACTDPTYVVSTVTRLHSLPPLASGQSFVIAMLDHEQDQSLAFRRYADKITTSLTRYGLRAVISREEAAKMWQNPADSLDRDRTAIRAPREINIYKGSTYDMPNRERAFEGYALSVGKKDQFESD
jgi:hypothetical protein